MSELILMGDDERAKSVYGSIMRRIILGAILAVYNEDDTSSEAKENILKGLGALSAAACEAGDYSASFMIRDVIRGIESGKSLRCFI